jgi:hypothetical protein
VAERLLGLQVRILLEAWVSDSCVCCALSSRGLYDGLIRRLEEIYCLWCVSVCSRDLKNKAALARVRILRQRKTMYPKNIKILLYYLLLLNVRT